MLSEGLTYSINGSFGLPEKTLSISFSKVNTKFCLSLDITIMIIVSFLLMEKKSLI